MPGRSSGCLTTFARSATRYGRTKLWGSKCRRRPTSLRRGRIRNGGVRWHHGWVNVSHVLAEEYIGLEEVADGIWSVYFGPLLLGRFDERDLKLSGAYAYNQPA
jgi:hypothetical protein